MKIRIHAFGTRAITRSEVVLLIALFLFFCAFFFAQRYKNRSRNQQIACVNNLKQIGAAFRSWAPTAAERFPMQVSTNKSGTLELIDSGLAFVHFQALSRQVSTPKPLICPADSSRTAAEDLAQLSNNNLSYFVGVDAQDSFPKGFLSGDRHLELNGVPVKAGLLTLGPKSPAGWTTATHPSLGSIAFTDGSVQTVITPSLRGALGQTGLSTNRLAIP